LERRLAAILAADVVGYSRLMEQNEADTFERLRAHRKELFEPEIKRHQGRIFKLVGDGLLAEFASVVNAVECATILQQAMAERNAGLADARRIDVRIGVNLGDVIVEGDDVHGDGVNIAARLEGFAAPGGICISDDAHRQIRDKLDAAFHDAGEQHLKNISRPVRIWKWTGATDPRSQGTASSQSTARDERTSIAVLPFLMLSSAAANEHLADSITEDLTTELSKIDSLFVISRTSALAYKGRGVRAAQVGEEIGADYIVEGSVQTAGNSVRVNAQLIETKGGGHLWAERFDGSLDSIFQFQDKITQKVVSALEVRFSGGEQVLLWRAEAADATAYEHFLRGRAYYKEYSRAGNARAKPEFQAALAITPTFIAAMVGLARTHIEDATFGWSPGREASLGEARRLLDSALSLNENHAMARAELAHFLMISGDYEAARQQVQRATSIDPNSAEAQNVTAFICLCLSLPREALKYARKAIQLNPGAPEFYLIVIADAYIMLKRYEEALPLLRRIVARRPSWITARVLLVICHEAMGRHYEACDAVKEIIEMSSSFNIARWRRCLLNPNRPDVEESAMMLRAAGLPE
jgi:adenylate cyclase